MASEVELVRILENYFFFFGISFFCSCFCLLLFSLLFQYTDRCICFALLFFFFSGVDLDDDGGNDVRGAEDDTSEIHRVPMPLDTGLD